MTTIEIDQHPNLLASAGEVAFLVTLRDGAEERVEGADAYQQEQSMTTFFRTEGRQTVDCWAVRMASFRTDHILAVRRLDARAGACAVTVGRRGGRRPDPMVWEAEGSSRNLAVGWIGESSDGVKGRLG